MATKTAVWPIRVGGMYEVKDRAPLQFRVTAIEGDQIWFNHYDATFTKENREWGPAMIFDSEVFCALTNPEDQSPIPALVEALKIALAALESYKTSGVGVHHNSIARVKEALARAGA